jgi:hypothetical protein
MRLPRENRRWSCSENTLRGHRVLLGAARIRREAVDSEARSHSRCYKYSHTPWRPRCSHITSRMIKVDELYDASSPLLPVWGGGGFRCFVACAENRHDNEHREGGCVACADGYTARADWVLPVKVTRRIPFPTPPNRHALHSSTYLHAASITTKRPQ